jgi:hypothetical protein
MHRNAVLSHAPRCDHVAIAQGFVNASFESITSTEHALSLLQQFQAILQRETLRNDLESK